MIQSRSLLASSRSVDRSCVRSLQRGSMVGAGDEYKVNLYSIRCSCVTADVLCVLAHVNVWFVGIAIIDNICTAFKSTVPATG